jgi:predicted transcriptional regulator
MPSSDPIAIRLPEDVLADLEEVSAATERSRSWVILRALRHYLAGEGGDILRIARSRRSAREEGVVDADDVLADMDRIIAGEAVDVR